jgi:signal transduction histidine kinase
MEPMTYTAVSLLLVCLVMAGLWRAERLRSARLHEDLVRERGINKRDQAFADQTRRRSEMLHRLVDGIDDGLFIVGPDMRVMFVNRGAQRYFPPVSQPVGRPLLECIRDQRLVEMIAKCSRESRRLQEEFLVAATGDDGMSKDRVYSVEAVPLNEDAPKAKDDAATLVILCDETAKHNLERIRKDFVANASHELRTPLSIINGYLENLVEGDITDTDETKRAFTVMKKHGDRLAHLVEDLLIISRMESGEHDALQMENFDFEQCANDVIHRLSPLIAAKEAKVKVSIDPKGEVELYGDRYYWDQILFNLVQNALKENQAKGLVVDIAVHQNGAHTEVIVRDNGVGIPQADMPFVFKRFYRVARTRPTDVKGTGLGLSIVKRAVEAHQGTITLRSRPGIETAFTILVPRKLS